jgi:hypothetical protein
MRTSISSGASANACATVVASTVRLPLPISCVAVLAIKRPFWMLSSTPQPGCQK